MDIKEYISSGILESYALGLCNGDEARDVEAMAKKHPEIKHELEQTQLAVNAYAQSHAKNPPATLKARIFDEITTLENAAETTQPVRVISMNTSLRWAVAASVALFVLSAIANLVLYNKWKAADEQIASLNNEKTLLSDNLTKNKVKFDGLKNDWAIINDTSMQKVLMKGVAKSPQSLACVYWNKSKNEVYLEIMNLPQPDAGKQYQLWAIVDGKPVDGGMIPLVHGDSVLMKMNNFASAQAFAITLEKQGGNPAPTLTEMYVMGGI